MNNALENMNKTYIEFNDKIAFHPGYYIKEVVDESGLTQEDFAKRSGTTPKNLSILIRGEQSLSVDMAMKLARMMGTSCDVWLNLQVTYDTLIAEYKSMLEFEKEKEVFKSLDYKYFRENFHLEDLPRKIDEQIKRVREFLNVASLTVLTKRDFAVSFRSANDNLTCSNIIKANAMVQIAINKTLKVNGPKYNNKKFEEAIQYALTLTTDHDNFYPLIYKKFLDAGVILTILPNISGSKINGATKKVGNKIMLMVNDRRLNSDTFWFTLLHEAGHIINGDYGISFENESGGTELFADQYARNQLIPLEDYARFINENKFDLYSIQQFAKSINRDPAIVLGRLENDKRVRNDDQSLHVLRHKYKITM